MFQNDDAAGFLRGQFLLPGIPEVIIPSELKFPETYVWFRIAYILLESKNELYQCQILAKRPVIKSGYSLPGNFLWFARELAKCGSVMWCPQGH